MGQNSKKIDTAKYVSKFLIYVAKMLDNCVKSQKKILFIVLFCKVKLSKMTSIKANKIKNGQHLSSPIFYDKQLCFGSMKIPQL